MYYFCIKVQSTLQSTAAAPMIKNKVIWEASELVCLSPAKSLTLAEFSNFALKGTEFSK